MTTTIMRDSKIGDNWIRQACAQNPVQRIIDPATGQYTGNFLSGPVRVMFPFLMSQRPGKDQQGNATLGKYEASILFTPYTDFTIFNEEYYKKCHEDWKDKLGPDGQTFYGLESPFHDQGMKMKYKGYTPGLLFTNVSSQYKPPVVDARMNPIVDPNRIYPGVWAILALNAYSFGKQQPKKGVKFGIQSVMIIADDENCNGGGAPDPKTQFTGVNVQPPTVNPAGAFGQPTAPSAPGGTNAHFVTPGAPPAMPAAPGYVPPAAPAYAPAATQPCFICTAPVVNGVCTGCGAAQ